MKIVTDSPNFNLCNNALETISHIYLQCPHTLASVNVLNDTTRLKIDHSYRDLNKKHYVICNHDNQSINYLILVAKWYLSLPCARPQCGAQFCSKLIACIRERNEQEIS
jgi:hypothetical protein